MTTTPFFDAADRAAERSVLVSHDFAELHGRVRAALRLRALVLGASVGVLVALLAAVGGFVAGARRDDAPVPATSSAAATALSAPCAPVPCGAPAMEQPAKEQPAKEQPAGPPIEVAPPPAPARPHASPRELSTAAPDLAPAPAALVEPEHEASRLRAQLALYQEAQGLAATDPDAALAAARRLRGEHARGPLVVEAGLLEARVLIRIARCDQARPLLNALQSEAHVAGKGAAWRELDAACAPVDAGSGDEESTPRLIIP